MKWEFFSVTLKRNNPKLKPHHLNHKRPIRDWLKRHAFSTCLLFYRGIWGGGSYISGTQSLAVSGRDDQGTPSPPGWVRQKQQTHLDSHPQLTLSLLLRFRFFRNSLPRFTAMFEGAKIQQPLAAGPWDVWAPGDRGEALCMKQVWEAPHSALSFNANMRYVHPQEVSSTLGTEKGRNWLYPGKEHDVPC